MSAPAVPPSNPFTDSPVYRMACDQLRGVAAVLPDVDPGVIERLMIPKRSQVSAVPIRMDDGATRVFVGYRVQHSLTSGASKGRAAVRPPGRFG